jgi:hypothetical protein
MEREQLLSFFPKEVAVMQLNVLSVVNVATKDRFMDMPYLGGLAVEVVR